MTPRQALEVSFAQLAQLRKAKERELHLVWEVARWQEWQECIMSPNIKAERKPSTPQAFARFAWDAPEREITREDCHISEETLAWLNKIKERYKSN